MSLLKTVTDAEILTAQNNVCDALSDALNIALNGHKETGVKTTSLVCIQIHADGDITTSIAGRVNKNQLFGACVELILSIHEFDRVGAEAKMVAAVDAQAEKFTTVERTDN